MLPSVCHRHEEVLVILIITRKSTIAHRLHTAARIVWPLRLTDCALQVRDDYGKEVGSQVCHIVGADGGVVPRPIALPSGGLMTDVAYRW